MGDSGWLVAIAFASLFNPIAIMAGAVSGLIVKRWWQILLGFAGASAAYLLYDHAFGHDEAATLLVSFMGVAGLAWTAAVFGFKRAWTT